MFDLVHISLLLSSLQINSIPAMKAGTCVASSILGKSKFVSSTFFSGVHRIPRLL